MFKLTVLSLLFCDLAEINFQKLFSRIWSTSSKKTLRRENVSFLQKTPSQCKEIPFSCFSRMGGWKMRVFLSAKAGSEVLGFFVQSLALAVQSHLGPLV